MGILSTSPNYGQKHLDEKRVPFQSLSLERLRYAGPFCGTGKQLERYKLSVCMQFVANHSYFCKYALVSFKQYYCS